MNQETVSVQVEGQIAEVVLVTPQALLGRSPVPPIRLPKTPDIGPKPIPIPMPICIPCPPVCPPSLGLPPICNPDVSLPKPLPKPRP